MANTRVVKVVNMVNKRVGITKPELGFRRRWTAKGQPQMIPYDVLEQLLWDAGVRYMFERGILYIEDMKTKIDLGLEPYNATEPVNIKVLNDSQITTLLKIRTFDEFKEEVLTLPIDQANNIVNFAIANNIMDIEKCEFLKELTGIDIITCITNNKAIEKADKAEKAKRASEK